MTLLTETSDISYAGLTGQDTFAYNFRVDLKTDMFITLDAAPVAQADFTMTGLGSPSGGNVVLNTPLVADANVILARGVAATQEVDYQPFDAFPAETHEGALDKLTMLVQQVASETLRGLRFPLGDTVDPVLPSVAARANKFLAFDPAGKPITLNATGSAVVAYGSFNISSPPVIAHTFGIVGVTRLNTGRYEVELSLPMLDIKYPVLVSIEGVSGAFATRFAFISNPKTDTKFQIHLLDNSGFFQDDAIRCNFWVYGEQL